MATAIAENQQLLKQTEDSLAASQERLEAYTSHESYNPSIESALEVIRKGIAVQESRMNEITAQLEARKKRRALELVSPVDGVVSQVWKAAGEVVVAGDPIVTIAKVRSAEVIGYANQALAGVIHENMPVEIVKITEPMQVASTTVTFVGPVMEQMPARLWPNPNVPQWGRPFKVELPSDMAVIPGEMVGIRGL